MEAPQSPVSAYTEAEEEEDDEKCGFCIFMKAGGCKKEFTVCLIS